MTSRPRSATPRSVPALVLAGALLLPLVPVPSVAARRAAPDATPPRTQVFDPARHSDANRLNMYTTNYGSFAHDEQTGSGGLVYPRGTDQRAVFASGLWLGCRVNGQVRVVLAEYGSEYGPGAMVGGTFDDPHRPEHRVYKVAPWRGDPADTAHRDRTPGEMAADPLLDPLDHHSWSEYLVGAAPYGAPTRVYSLPDPSTPDPFDLVDVIGPDMLGDRMLWEVHNDADPARHSTFAGRTQPLGVEIQQTTFAIGSAPPGLGDIVFLKFRIINKGGNTLDDLFVSLWSDPDVGGFTDDLVGCDIGRGVGFAYNATNTDAVYGSEPPAVGYLFLNSPMTAFSKYINGTDPNSFGEVYNYMRGLLPDGSVLIDPTTLLPTAFFHPGDPVSGQGWLDSNPSDRRFLLSSGPTRMAPEDTTDVWAAIVVGQVQDRLSSVILMRCLADQARILFQQNFATFPPLPPLCSPPPPVNCPKPNSFWALECQAGGAGLLSPAQLQNVAEFVHHQATLFDWPADTLPQFCATVNPAGFPDLRQQARSEFAAFLGNYAGSQMDLSLGNGQRIWLGPLTEVSCPPLRARTVEELAQPVSLNVGFLDGNYLNHVADHRIALEGIPAGLTGFGGGAGEAFSFLGSALDPSTQPDSFMTVEIRFDHTKTQKAYRYLRLETQTGGAPPQGRAYLYGGHRTVPFTCWDIQHNVQLDVGFAERTITDGSGTILDHAFQPATHDSTWGPDASELGGREYLIVFSRPYSANPKPDLAQDGFIISGVTPALYALWSRLRSSADVIDDGDAFQWVWGQPPSPGADSLLVTLEGQSLADPAVQQAYQDLIHCLSQINNGIGIGPTCDSGPTPVLVSLVSAEAAFDRVSLRWFADGPLRGATVERRAEGNEWSAIGRVTPDGEGYLAFEDRDVTPGGRYEYRLKVESPDGVEYLGGVRVEVPSDAVLAFLGVSSRPGDGRLVIAFSLAGHAPARVEVHDIAGRRLFARDLTGLGPGMHTLAMDDAVRLPSGVYLVRILQGGERVTGKTAVVR